MYWTLELASKLEDAPWPATKEELIDYATRSGAPLEVIENLEDLEEDGEVYDSIEDIRACCRAVKTTQDIHHCRFPGTGWSHYGNILIFVNYDIYSIKGFHLLIANFVEFFYSFDNDDFLVHLVLV